MWQVVTVDYFDDWFLSLNAAEQQGILTAIFKLQSIGPLLGRPDVDTLSGVHRVKNLKELRVQHKGKPYRVLFAFDPKRQAVMLCGGDKTGDKRFYDRMIPIAEREFIAHLEKLD
ncbi:type II toxin-antitoxin system RelE/ParE family toxin [Thiomicrospira microaerophila]|uniref:type II toxin-antitoxin system RelE/ParE family toxin n=1 Tax=Thiomicrospira microaerophila TaxID=406020 RepID=UPI00200C2A0E|nr:type II toxin-antitoxin system RelE/ParE family toxin [Thiomicrospira microaerophila]UQB41877.1 type II toxin-antitoxin system RelE/ParE family toxin [Thiomicrospira microaerophila]